MAGAPVSCLLGFVETAEQGASVADATDFEVARIFGEGDAFGMRARRRFPSGRGSFIVESLVGSNLVVGFSNTLEHALLHAEVGAGRFRSVGFESSVHSLVGAVLLTVSGGMRWWVTPSWSHQTST
jgi:hypothetical protein